MRYRSNLLLSRCLAFIALFVTCAAGAAEKGSLTIWTGDESAAAGIRKVAESYTRRTGVKVTVSVPDPSGGSAVGAFQSAMEKNETRRAPDIFVWPHDNIGDWARKGWLAPLAPSDKLKEDVFQIAWDAVTSNGKQWAYPISVEVLTMVYNKSLVSEPPKTYEEIPALQQKLKAKGVTGIAWELRSAYYSWPLLAAGGAHIFQRDLMGNYIPKQTGVNLPSVVKGAEFLVRMVKSDVLSATTLTKDTEEAMKNGKLAILITGPWAWGELSKAGINYGIAPLPTFEGRPARPFVGVVGAMITASSPNKREAADFLESAVVTPDGLREINKLRPLGIPASKELFWSFYSDPNIRKAMESVFAGYVMPNNPEMRLYWKYFDKALADVIAGSAKPKDAFDAAAKAMAAGQ